MLRVRGEASVDQLNAALRRVQVRHPALVAGSPGDSAAFPLAVRAGCGEADWLEAAQAELREGWPERPAAFVRFVMLRREGGFDLLLNLHHDVSDGMSGVFLLRDLLQALADPEGRLEPILPSPPLSALIPRAALTSSALRRRVALATARLRAGVLLAKLRTRLAPWRATPPPPGGEVPLNQQFIILTARLSAPQTAALLARCKQERVTVHPAVCVAWLRALTSVSGARFGTVSSPVNLRGRLSQDIGEASGLYLGCVNTRLECAPGQRFWDLAREFKQRLDAEMRDERLFFGPLLCARAFSQVPDVDHGLVSRILFSGPVDHDLSITNLGHIILPEHSGTLRVEAFHGLVNSSEFERTVTVGTVAGQMSFAYLVRRSLADPANAKALMDRALALLVQATDAEVA
jgi:hypothetical protein